MLENPGCDGQMVAPTEERFRKAMWPTFRRFCPPDLIRKVVKKDKAIHLVTGQTLWWGSAHVPGSLDGSTLGVIWADEIRYWRFEAWQTLETRLRDGIAPAPQCIATSTPAMGWMQELFDNDLPDHEVVKIGTEENAHNLRKGYAESLRQIYTEQQCRALLKGEFVTLDRQVFSHFDMEKHIVDYTVDPRLQTSVWMDFGFRQSSVLIAQHVGQFGGWANGRRLPPYATVIIDELQPENKPTKAIIPIIQALLRKYDLIYHPTWIFCDPAGRQHDPNSGMPSVEYLRRAFPQTRVAWQEGDARYVPNGIAEVEGMFQPNDGPPLLYIDRRVTQHKGKTPDNDFTRGLLATLNKYTYPEDRHGRASSDHPDKRSPLSHCADTLRYGVLNTQRIPNGRDMEWQSHPIDRGGGY
jgi:hypothetical protein